MSLAAKILRRGPADLLLAGEALLLLAFFRVCLAFVPVRRILAAITHGGAGDGPGANAEDAMDDWEFRTALRVQWAVRAAVRHSAVRFVCFPQTLAAYTMLRCRGVSSTIVYGVARLTDGELIAHTWLEAAGGSVVGGEEAGRFSELGRWT